MARNVVPASITFSCDCCECDCGSAPNLRLSGLRDADDEPRPYTLDLCSECLTKFDEWLTTQKSQV